MNSVLIKYQIKKRFQALLIARNLFFLFNLVIQHRAGGPFAIIKIDFFEYLVYQDRK